MRTLKLRCGAGTTELTVPSDAPVQEHGIRDGLPTARDPATALARALDPLRRSEFADLLRCFRETSARLLERLPALTDTELSASLGHKMPQGDETLRGMVAFLVFHEAYHVGQIGYLKKQLGYAPLIR